MFETAHVLASPTGARLRLRERAAIGRARGILLVQHGLAEHSERYGAFAGEMAARGWTVVAHDHRGHGETHAPDAPPRRFAAQDGARAVIADAHAVRLHAIARYGELPTVVFGHSMGGLVAMNVALAHGAGLAGVGLWNSNFDFGAQGVTARVALKAERALKGSDAASALLARATFESWGRTVPNRRTEADWLSHDTAQVDRYRADPLCGWTATISMFGDLLDLIERGREMGGLRRLDPALPFHLVGGGADPATANGRAVARHAARLREAGLCDVTHVAISGARHETLNEIAPFREPALASLTEWLDRIASR